MYTLFKNIFSLAESNQYTTVPEIRLVASEVSGFATSTTSISSQCRS